MAPRTAQINRQAQLMGLTVIKKGRTYRILDGDVLVAQFSSLLHVQSFFFSKASINPTAIARQAFNSKTAA